MARSGHEGEPIARWLNSIGVAAFVINYRVALFTFPAQFEDAQRAIRLVRYRAEDWLSLVEPGECQELKPG